MPVSGALRLIDTHPRFGTRLEWRVRAIRPHTAPLPPTLA
jgi:hypothetical protein